MADLGKAVRAYLLSKVGITDLVGTTRIYTDQLPQQATLPAIVMNQLFTTHEHALSDFAGLAHARLQFECYAATRLVANSMAEAIRSSGIITQKGSTSGVDIRGVRVEEGLSFKDDAPTDGGADHRYVSVIDLVIDYTET
jgi:hypothetical protein